MTKMVSRLALGVFTVILLTVTGARVVGQSTETYVLVAYTQGMDHTGYRVVVDVARGAVEKTPLSGLFYPLGFSPDGETSVLLLYGDGDMPQMMLDHWCTGDLTAIPCDMGNRLDLFRLDWSPDSGALLSSCFDVSRNGS